MFKKQLMPKIGKHDDPLVFWADCASCHYTRSALEWYCQLCPQKHESSKLCPIEKFWASIKRELLKKGKIAADFDQFRRILGVFSRNYTKTVV